MRREAEPAYLFGLMGLLSVLTLVSMIQAGPSHDPRGPAAGWLHLGHQALTTTFSVPIAWLFLVRRPSAQPRGAGGRFPDVAAIAGTVVVLGISQAPRTEENLVVIAAVFVALSLVYPLGAGDITIAGLLGAMAGLIGVFTALLVGFFAGGIGRSSSWRWATHAR